MSASKPLSVALAQINSCVGDFEGNSRLILEAAAKAAAAGADILITPEMSVVGYPAEDWLLRDDFCLAAWSALERLAEALGSAGAPPVIAGCVRLADRRRENVAVLVRDGCIDGVYAKRHLPEYGVFDETRVFTPGSRPLVFELGGVPAGVAVCEDMWYEDTAADAALAGAKVLLVPNASPYFSGKRAGREATVCANAAAAGLPMAYVNLVGGQDELVFDGCSFVSDAEGRVCRRLAGFREDFAVFEIPPEPVPYPEIDVMGELYEALVLAVRDYVGKNGFRAVTLGLSGGVDSALVAAIAADAVGPQNVHAVMMPTRFTADLSFSGAERLARNLGIHYSVRAIEPLFEAYTKLLAPDFAGRGWDVTEENLQARIRGMLLMAYSNKFGRLVLTTGNKSESAVGYSTLYGDTAGAFAPIRDVLKTDVWALCRWRNRKEGRDVIPVEIIERPPSAELRQGQLDQDSLPDYALLDRIIHLYVEEKKSFEEIEAEGVDGAVARRVARMIHRSEYKRRQCPVGPKVTQMAFGRDWRFPMTARPGRG